MNLAIYLLASYLAAAIAVAFMNTSGPEELFVNAFIVWLLPAVAAALLAIRRARLSSYLGPAVLLVIVACLMMIGRGIIVV